MKEIIDVLSKFGDELPENKNKMDDSFDGMRYALENYLGPPKGWKPGQKIEPTIVMPEGYVPPTER